MTLSQGIYQFDQEKLSLKIELYKQAFPIGNKAKWQMVKCFQDNWDIDAEDFPAMLKRSLGKCSSLINKALSTRKQILDLANARPEEVRNMFKSLFSEEKPLLDRIRAFEKDAHKINKEIGGPKTFVQDGKVQIVYLWLYKPEQYFLYLWEEYEAIYEKICYDPFRKQKFLREKPYINRNTAKTQKFFGELCDELTKDEELCALVRSNLPDNCDKDIAFHTMTFDFATYVKDPKKYRGQ